MAKDGFLPRALIGKEGKPPTLSVVLQGALALVVVFTQSLKDVLGKVGAILVLFAALTVLGLFRARIQGQSVKTSALIAAGIYCVSAGYMLYTGFHENLALLGWVAAMSLVAMIAWMLTRAPKALKA
jgi:hypothetical protein